MEHRGCNTLRRTCAIITFALVLTPCLTLDAIATIFWQRTHFEVRFVDEENVKKSPAMDSKSLVNAQLSFLTKEFQVEEAEELWGEIEIKTNANNLFLTPKYDWIERVSLGFVDENGKKFFSSISIDLKESTSIDTNNLIAAFGEPNELPRLKPNQPHPYSFEVQGKDFSGHLTIGLEPGKGRFRNLKGFDFVRFPPSWSEDK